MLPWRWISPPTTAFILQEEFTRSTDVHYRWVPMQHISPRLAIAVVASEDQRFPFHYGFDFDAITLAFKERRSRLRGASTISQQVAKNLFLWNGHSYVRKGIEAYLTVLIEALWPKYRILEIYLNVAEFGPGVYGAGPASKLFFGKTAMNLTLDEATLLAAVLPNPKRMSAASPSRYVSKRAYEIQDAVRSLGGSHYLDRL